MTGIISRILAIFMTLVSLILPAKPNNVEVTVKEMTTESAAIVYTCVNNTGRRIDRPDIVKLEKNNGGEWEEVEIGFSRTEIAYFVNPGKKCVESADFCGIIDGVPTFENQHLEKGEYRLTIGYTVSTFDEESKHGQGVCIFTVTEAIR